MLCVMLRARRKKLRARSASSRRAVCVRSYTYKPLYDARTARGCRFCDNMSKPSVSAMDWSKSDAALAKDPEFGYAMARFTSLPGPARVAAAVHALKQKHHTVKVVRTVRALVHPRVSPAPFGHYCGGCGGEED